MWYIRALFICIIGAGLIYILGREIPHSFTQEGVRCAHCNVVLISIDTLGHDHLSLYDPSLDTSPFLTSLAKNSVVFNRAFSQAPWTLPSHVAMLTGQYPWDLNIWIPSDVLSPDVLTLAEQLQAYGYKTAAFSNGAFVRPGWGLDQGFDEFYGSVQEKDWEDVPKIFTDASAWIEKRNSTEPFFLLIRPFEVHDPYIENGETVTVQEIAALNLSKSADTAMAASRYRELYRAEIRKTDAALKEFFTSLRDAGLLDSTIVIVTSDHGEEFGEHGTVGFHAVTTYREVLHVPLLIRTPSTQSARVDRSVEIRSIPATIFDLIGMPTNYTLAPSLVPYMEGVDLGDQTARARTALNRNTLLTNFVHGYGALGLIPKRRLTPYTGPYTDSVLVGSAHGIRHENGTVEYFNLETDFAERNPTSTTTTLTDDLQKVSTLLNVR